MISSWRCNPIQSCWYFIPAPLPQVIFPFFYLFIVISRKNHAACTVTRGSAIQDVTMSNSLSLPASSPFFFLQKRELFLG